MSKTKDFSIPKEVSHVTDKLESAGFEAYLVGGCVRDLLHGKKPKDWDVTTNATPDQILPLFEHAFYENDFGTVGVVNESCEDKTLEVIEVTTYRLEAAYSDSRHPDAVTFSSKLEDDLKRRDFTINAIAYGISQNKIVDPFNGQIDISKEILRAVGNPLERFKEDALRILRAVRFMAELHFEIEEETKKAIEEAAPALANIAKERIRDEFIRILESNNPMNALIKAHELGVLEYITRKLEEGIGIEQNQAHKYDVWEHNLRSLQHAVDKKWNIIIRLAALFHDIGKPRARKWSDEKKDWTFHGHEVIGARMAERILADLKFPKKTIEDVTKLVRWHMFFSDTEKITLSAVRRLLRNVGHENVWHLMDLRACDRIGTGRPKENPYRFRKYKAMIEEVLEDPINVTMLKINGSDLISLLGIEPGPKIGHILHALLEETLEDPSKNTKEFLEKRAQQLNRMDIDELKKLGDQGRIKKEKTEEENIAKIHRKYWVD
ncbi:MAG: polynucleotide adenylyltransferase [Parcubacteria group bacterium Gr01-1014_48]|nr:MAG: polynucleotide adenylyltransferase [Parcubacteria group bacterium Greene0416_14]TSC73687.1 MAG: polynucleotide adenylyltransferase [Parcubacteria group bacterium Gr01-1014_48]TSD00267.1 MAG: polynucleotide adenylyltransferase [Parcubacteria group bacterium Greene1014_15]TSD07499.1 MAG: polynucleotide adenylyltransferase [Parcubacteria group bacterium Greene0714_4]